MELLLKSYLPIEVSQELAAQRVRKVSLFTGEDVLIPNDEQRWTRFPITLAAKLRNLDSFRHTVSYLATLTNLLLRHAFCGSLGSEDITVLISLLVSMGLLLRQ